MTGYALDEKKLSLICERPNVLDKLINYLDDDSAIASGACRALINISADEKARANLLPLDANNCRQVLFSQKFRK